MLECDPEIRLLSLPSLLLCPSTFLSEIPQMFLHSPHVPTYPLLFMPPTSHPRISESYNRYRSILSSIPPHDVYESYQKVSIPILGALYLFNEANLTTFFFFSVRFFFVKLGLEVGVGVVFCCLLGSFEFGVWWLVVNA